MFLTFPAVYKAAIYRTDSAWTNNSGYVQRGVAQTGREEQSYPITGLCGAQVPNKRFLYPHQQGRYIS
jgi:hypothetical protein